MVGQLVEPGSRVVVGPPAEVVLDPPGRRGDRR
jgi:hypothetical protein